MWALRRKTQSIGVLGLGLILIVLTWRLQQLKVRRAGVSNAVAAVLLVIGVVAGIVAFSFFTSTSRPGVQTVTHEETYTSVSMQKVTVTTTETVMSIETQTKYMAPPANTTLELTPSVAAAGTVMYLVGGGLPANTRLWLESCPGEFPLTTFTTDSYGNVPKNATFLLPQIPNPGPETGALTTWEIDTPMGCGQGPNPLATVRFTYEATMTLSSAAGPAGMTLTVSASGLVPGGVYDVVFNYVELSTNPNKYNGTIIGDIIANGAGQGGANVTVPDSASMGFYQIGLVSTHNLEAMVPVNASALVIIPGFWI